MLGTQRATTHGGTRPGRNHPRGTSPGGDKSWVHRLKGGQILGATTHRGTSPGHNYPRGDKSWAQRPTGGQVLGPPLRAGKGRGSWRLGHAHGDGAGCSLAGSSGLPSEAVPPRPPRGNTHDLAEAALHLHVGLAVVVDVGFAVLAPQAKFVVDWRWGGRRRGGKERQCDTAAVGTAGLESSPALAPSPRPDRGPQPQPPQDSRTIMRAQTSQNLGFLK